MTDQRKYVSKLAGKHVLIIGGSSGIGYGVAEASLEHGATVTISSSNASRLDAAVAKLSTSYPTAAADSRISAGVVCDLSNEDTLEANIANLFATITGRPSPANTIINHVVYCAGDALATLPLADASLPRIKQAGAVRFFGPLLAAREAAKHLPRSTTSSFTLTSGSVAQRPLPGGWAVVGSYATGLLGMARSLALELAPVRVNCVAPGVVDTGLWRTMGDAEKEEMFRGVEEKLPTGRVGRVEDVVEAYLYLMRDGNATGSVVSTNGGALLV
ncbi:Short-chain dehydrogenase/reductase SDR [Lasiodiplodia theobromae]|uniref:3-oxoacyl-(Acyl-carrier-protein) reductase FabG n=1 Tax=Lasiodiplodia theobromae TaxID=45133 RepID=A0A5N5D0R1_9PEZI|nr:Short-chain dehydrogenase/reductase SDR [Lasiodiplodia theobromae]KAB2571248.1 3-oxoacyl-(acyl-carrier-protein) reductase FabG [Lasiodiplodia theobromae]KAF4542769.1 Short-chain dehydrogenase/reductase SDR [Lasiodiplodia theobromae]KAF9640888.1 Short-chain dehydrogenase/reductase SDR [Lasiodiplodia theobromae]